MKRYIFARLVIAAVFLGGIITAFTLMNGAGCTDLQKQQAQGALSNISTMTSPTGTPPANTPAATQPVSQTVLTGENVVKVIETFVPASTTIFTLVSGVTGLLAGLVGGAKAGSAVATAQSSSKVTTLTGAITEITDDIAAFKQPGVNWSNATHKVLQDVVGVFHPAAAPVVVETENAQVTTTKTA